MMKITGIYKFVIESILAKLSQVEHELGTAKPHLVFINVGNLKNKLKQSTIDNPKTQGRKMYSKLASSLLERFVRFWKIWKIDLLKNSTILVQNKIEWN